MHYWLRVALTSALLAAPFACHPPADVRAPKPEVVLTPEAAVAAYARAQQVFENRCVVCHGCYDAPCQLKLGTWEGVERGGTEKVVYDGARLIASDPTRLGIDAQDKSEWRDKGFHPVLAEGKHADPRASVLLRMLELKRRHPLTESTDVAKDFTLELDRKQTCTDAAHFDDFAKEHPSWGMPYALPGIAPEDEAAIVQWVRAGTPHGELAPLPAAVSGRLDAWETFLNDPSPKGQLVARYIYEHLFLASIRVEEEGKYLFRLVRSKSERGLPLREVATRRPFDDPKVPRVYYRFVRRTERSLDKTLMPYALLPERLERWQKLFFEKPWEVTTAPGYDPEVASNPFRAFDAIPMSARYRFMLEEAGFTIMGFIKGPVCRGQVALNVIEDRFWVTFVDPDVPWQTEEAAFLAQEKLDLDLPAEAGSNALPTLWFRYGDAHQRYVAKKADLLERVSKDGKGLSMATIWDGDGKNPNAALTVFRHFDSATVVKGLVGGPPKTSWVIDYPLLERIHYLLVAGFDVFGNVGHQLTTRLYMDYLRMAAETNFLAFLPPERRHTLVEHWYRGVTGEAKERVRRALIGKTGAPSLQLPAEEPERRLFELLRARIGPALTTWRELANEKGTPLGELDGLRGQAASFMPETAFLVVDDGDYFTLSRESGHTNVAHLFNEDKRRLPDEDAIAVTAGFLGAYPNAIFQVKSADLAAFVAAVTKLASAADYRALRAKYGILRTSDRFWPLSDRMNKAHVERSPIEGGLFDYNRLEAY